MMLIKVIFNKKIYFGLIIEIKFLYNIIFFLFKNFIFINISI